MALVQVGATVNVRSQGVRTASKASSMPHPIPNEAQRLILAPEQDGWLVEVSMPRLGGGEPGQMLFAAAIEDAPAAVAAVRRAIGGLRCEVEARCRLSPRALTQLTVRSGHVKPF
jgi:hypothetical protein